MSEVSGDDEWRFLELSEARGGEDCSEMKGDGMHAHLANGARRQLLLQSLARRALLVQVRRERHLVEGEAVDEALELRDARRQRRLELGRLRVARGGGVALRGGQNG